MAFLPSAHIAQRVVIEFLPLRCGHAGDDFAESLLKLPQEIRKVRPTILLAPPRMWERIYSTICTELRKRPAPAQKAFYGALGWRWPRHGTGARASRFRCASAAPLAIADRLMFRKIRARFGGRLKVAASGAAPLSKDLAEFYEAVGMPLIEGYGLTEGGVVSLNPLDRPKPGSIGKALPGVEVRVSDDGELLVKSPCLFSGYFNDPATTAEVLRDGWLHTGDIGYRDSDGLHFHHRPQEGTDRLLDRQEDLSVARGEPVQDGAADQPGAADRRPAAVPDRAVHAQSGRGRGAEGHGRVQGQAGGGDVRRRRRCCRKSRRPWRG